MRDRSVTIAQLTTVNLQTSRVEAIIESDFPKMKVLSLLIPVAFVAAQTPTSSDTSAISQEQTTFKPTLTAINQSSTKQFDIGQATSAIQSVGGEITNAFNSLVPKSNEMQFELNSVLGSLTFALWALS
jgi:hypothetical protein